MNYRDKIFFINNEVANIYRMVDKRKEYKKIKIKNDMVKNNINYYNNRIKRNKAILKRFILECIKNSNNHHNIQHYKMILKNLSYIKVLKYYK